MSRSKKVCLLRRPAEIESLQALRKLHLQAKSGEITEAEAWAELERYELPDCRHHHHISAREARKMERGAVLAFVPGWNDQYAQVSYQRDVNPRYWVKRFSGPYEVLQLMEA